ncbi:MAG: hypothetical protein IT370_26095 [Deltaproteobacteria bacterium]|nr:hypothetical protein [Deltaproteobacteria bacterium]
MKKPGWFGVVLVTTVLVAAAACEKKKKPAPAKVAGPTGTGAGAGARKDVPAPAGASAAGAIELTLLEAGAEPRQRLEYQLSAGVKQSFELRMKMNMGMEMSGTKMPIPEIPAFIMVMDLEVSTVSPAGEATWSAKINKAEMEAGGDPSMARAMGSSLDGLKGMSYRGKLARNGRMSGLEIDLPGTLPPQLSQMVDSMKQQMQQMTMPFPDEAVGVGARWKVAQKVALTGFAIDSTIENKLVAREGSRAVIEVKMSQSAPAQKMKLPGMPVDADLTRLSGQGGGKMTYGLARAPWPEDVAMNLDMDMGMAVEQGGKRQELGMSIGMNMTGKLR